MSLGKFFPVLECQEFKNSKFNEIRPVAALILSLSLQNLTTMLFTVQKSTSILNGKTFMMLYFSKEEHVMFSFDILSILKLISTLSFLRLNRHIAFKAFLPSDSYSSLVVTLPQ